jgi:hypothetical protein
MQVLLTISDKYDMPALRAMAGAFLQANKQHLSSSRSWFGTDPLYAWKWIALADKSGLIDEAKACFDSCLSRGDGGHALLEECTERRLQGMSYNMLCHMCSQLARTRCVAGTGYRTAPATEQQGFNQIWQNTWWIRRRVSSAARCTALLLALASALLLALAGGKVMVLCACWLTPLGRQAVHLGQAILRLIFILGFAAILGFAHTMTLEVGILLECGVPLGWNLPPKTPGIPGFSLLETSQGGIMHSKNRILHSPPLNSSFHPAPFFYRPCHLPPAIAPAPVPPGIPGVDQPHTCRTWNMQKLEYQIDACKSTNYGRTQRCLPIMTRDDMTNTTRHAASTRQCC